MRRQGHSPPDAQDLTQEFFARLLQKDYLKAAAREKGRFRTFLIVALKRFLANEWDRVPQGEAGKAFYQRVAQLSGLPLDVVTQARGFIEGAYVKNLRSDGKIVSRYDATFAVDDPYPGAALRARPRSDPRRHLARLWRRHGGLRA